MVGGSINGRPFREDPSSYARTGIPCGNPRRYNSRGVVRMAPNPKAPFEDQRLDIPPLEYTETEGERQFKRLLDKQLNKEMTINQLLQEKRVFTSPATYHPLTEEVSGKLLLSDFQAVEQEKERKMQLQQCGLTAEEIALKELSEDRIKRQKLSGYGIEPNILQDKLADIEDKIATKQKELEKPTKSRDVCYMSRHEMEIELSLKNNCEQAQLFQKLVSAEQSMTEHTHPNDPINHLKGLEQQLFGHLQRKRKKQKKQKLTAEAQEVRPETSRERLLDGCELHVPVGTSESEMARASKRSAKHFRPKPLVFHDAESIRSNKITVEEIRLLPKFENYTCGEPSKTLFVKNLTKNVYLDDLHSVFSACCEPGDPPPIIRLMTGRMRGQAFVEFSDTPRASLALSLVNGFKLNDRPIIIQYGKSGAS